MSSGAGPPSDSRSSTGAGDLREMQQAVDRSDGVECLLRWLARRLGVSVALLDTAARPVYAFPRLPRDLVIRAEADIWRVLTRQVHSATVDVDTHVLHILAVDHRRPGMALLVASTDSPPPAARGLLADALRLLRMRWRMEDAERRWRAVEEAGWRTREAVLHLLMIGDTSGAERVATALQPPLPDPLRVYVIECAGNDRAEVAARLLDAAQSAAWVVRCPVYDQHLIVLAPTGGAGTSEAAGSAPHPGRHVRDTMRKLADSGENVRVGQSEHVPLRDFGAGYEQAFHAIATARGSGERYAVFSRGRDLSLVLGHEGQAWARATLAPLLRYVPERRQDPDGRDLLVTLRSWLDFYGGAARQLRIHRNTLGTRLRRIEGLLGCDLGDLTQQARLHLALRSLENHPRALAAEPVDGWVRLEEQLATSEARRWAADLLTPLIEEDTGWYVTTLRTWLECNARLELTATTLGISVPGTRKRLRRMEKLLGRSLLEGPSMRYDALFAFQIHYPSEGMAA